MEWKPIEEAKKDGRRLLLGAWRTGRNQTERNWHCYVGKWHIRQNVWFLLPGGIMFWPTHFKELNFDDLPCGIK